MPALKTPKCLVRSCENRKIRSRGLCTVDYAIAADAVRSKKMTWEKLEREGKCLASKKPRRDKKIDWFAHGKVK